MLIETPVVAQETKPLPAECSLGPQPPEGFVVPAKPPAGAPNEVVQSWALTVIQMRFNSVNTANDVNAERLTRCKDGIPDGASVPVG